jgi:hypothetical protein
VLPQTARATVNFRVAPWDTAHGVRAHVEAVVRADPLLAGQVHVTMVDDSALPPSPVTPADSAGFHTVSAALHDALADGVGLAPWLPDLLIVPSITVGNTGAHMHTVRDAPTSAASLMPLGSWGNRHAPLLECDRLYSATESGGADAGRPGAPARRRRAHWRAQLCARDCLLYPLAPALGPPHRPPTILSPARRPLVYTSAMCQRAIG